MAERSAFVATVDRVEVRQSGNGDEFTMTGHAAVFDRWSEDLSVFGETFREKIAPGAFAEVLESKPDVRLLFNHDGLALARTKSGTLELSEDEEGLKVWARLAPTSYASDLRMAMQRGDVDQMSFAFAVAEDEWREDHDENLVERVITRVAELFDVSVVTFPAYPDTDAVMREMRSAAAAGKISLPDNVASDDPAGEESDLEGAQAETDPAVGEDRDASAEAETDPPVSGMAALKTESRFAVQEAKESYLRSLKEITR